jgi:hypothetical protein
MQQEAHEIGGGDRFDLRAQAVDRVAVDACEKPSIAPFEPVTLTLTLSLVARARETFSRLRNRRKGGYGGKPWVSLCSFTGEPREARGGGKADAATPWRT